MDSLQRRRHVDDFVRRCHAGLDAATLSREVFRRLGSIVPVDAAFFATVDPATLLFTSAVSDEPLAGAGPQFLANEIGGSDVNRFVDLAAGPVPVRWLDQVTSGNRSDSARYATIMRPLGLGDELRAALRTGDTCWGVMCLHRADGTAGFGERDAAVVGRLAPHIAEGLRRATLLAGFDSPAAPAAHGVLVLDDDGVVVSMNEAAERILGEVGVEHRSWSSGVPVPILSAATAACSETGDPSVRLRTTTGAWLAVHASRLRGAGGTQTVVVIEPAERPQLTSLILDAHAVTGAQARVVALVLRGRSTQQIVNELHISAYTVQEHLKAVFDKFGVRSRRELAAMLLHA